jgi:hypothetical protein
MRTGIWEGSWIVEFCTVTTNYLTTRILQCTMYTVTLYISSIVIYLG